MEKAVEVSRQVGSRMVVHTTNSGACGSITILFFNKGDIYTHVFAQRGYSIQTESGTLSPSVFASQKPGVIFDAADARVHYAFPVIRQALQENFLPDTISTDLVQGSLFQPGVFGLPRILSKYLALGVPLVQVIKAVTYRAAQALEKKNGWERWNLVSVVMWLFSGRKFTMAE
ncbi:hypothetical protein [Anaeromassilibacillus sp. SJQ-1]|uniref:hypothetical protein n=1 Tax=Anaeromassilibacillus sp. SJQ-1 TaxID=3375419 RepID=UPI003989B94A